MRKRALEVPPRVRRTPIVASEGECGEMRRSTTSDEENR